MALKSTWLATFLRNQIVYLFLALVACAIFWAIGMPVNFITVILYSFCIGNFLSPSVQRLEFLYQKPAPYDWIIFLLLLCVLTGPVYVLSSVIVWWIAPPDSQTLSHLILTGWKL